MMVATTEFISNLNLRHILGHAPSILRELWDKWELQTLVLLSLAAQILLTVFGNRRKFSNKPWLSDLLWCSYIFAYWIATVALGVLSINVGNTATDNGVDGSPQEADPNIRLTAFWAPFLLLHLGGPDSISSYSLEDNELWKRQSLGLVAQTIVAVRIILRAKLDVWLLIVTIPMMVAGVIRYGERIWVLRSASSEVFRDSMLTDPDPGPNYHKFMEEFTLRRVEGYFAQAQELYEVQLPEDDVSPDRRSAIPDASALIKADKLFKNFKLLFVDLFLSWNDRERSRSWFQDMKHNEAFKVVEIELGFMFDVLHTKVPIVLSVPGCIIRLISFSITPIVFVLFHLLVADRHKFSTFDQAITLLLLVVAILLELFALVSLLSSDWADLYRSKHQVPLVGSIISRLQWLKQPARWSNSLSQYSFLSFCLYNRPLTCRGLLKFFGLHRHLEEYRHRSKLCVPDNLKKQIFVHLKGLAQKNREERSNRDGQAKKNPEERSNRDGLAEKNPEERSNRDGLRSSVRIMLGKYSQLDLTWSVNEEFDRSILIWHIATDICYQEDIGADLGSEAQEDREMSEQLSYYMIYLHILRPSMLPMGIGSIRYRDTHAEAVQFFKEQHSIITPGRSNTNAFQRVAAFVTCRSRESQDIFEKRFACKMLLKVSTVVPPSQVKGDRSKSVFFDGCRLASKLQGIEDKKDKWQMVRDVWLEMLCYAASQCRATSHAQQLRWGGELLTHIWLLMAHLGLTDHFRILQGHARAKLVIE